MADKNNYLKIGHYMDTKMANIILTTNYDVSSTYVASMKLIEDDDILKSNLYSVGFLITRALTGMKKDRIIELCKDSKESKANILKRSDAIKDDKMKEIAQELLRGEMGEKEIEEMK